jgi:hypothetical protein
MLSLFLLLNVDFILPPMAMRTEMIDANIIKPLIVNLTLEQCYLTPFLNYIRGPYRVCYASDPSVTAIGQVILDLLTFSA